MKLKERAKKKVEGMDAEVKMPPVIVKIEGNLLERVKQLASKVPDEFQKYFVVVTSQF